MSKAKTKTTFLCQECGAVHAKWMGRCPDCGAWDALDAFREPAAATESTHAPIVEVWTPDGAESAPGAQPLPEVETSDVPRLPSGIGEFDRVLGGGFVPGSIVLLGGDPGIGKSTLLLQAAAAMAESGTRVLYASSEESAFQTRMRAERLFGGDLDRLGSLYVLADTNLVRIAEQARRIRPGLLVLDSIQMVFRPDLDSSPGSPSQIRRCCTDLVHLAKATGTTIALVGHVTKEGSLAGPKLLEHLVDTVLSFEGDRHHAHRVVRSTKNRFGTTLEVGLFAMTGDGLREVRENDRVDAGVARPGAVVAPIVTGTRCLMVELQALTTPTFPGTAKRKASGVDASRLAMIVAVLEQHGGLSLQDRDVYASAAGGLRVIEPAADLALALAIAGATLRSTLPPGTAVMGELGLGGEIRPVHQVEARVRESRRLGFGRIIGAEGQGAISTLSEALAEMARYEHK